MRKTIATIALAVSALFVAVPVASAHGSSDLRPTIGVGQTPCLSFPETLTIGLACTEEDREAIRDYRRERAAERRAEREAEKAAEVQALINEMSK